MAKSSPWSSREKNVEDCRQYIEEARKAIAEYEMILRDKASRPDDHKQGQQNRGTEDMQRESVFVTASFGAADSRNGREPAEVIKLADAALYKAKKSRSKLHQSESELIT